MRNNPALPAAIGLISSLLIVLPAWVLLAGKRSRSRLVMAVALVVEKEPQPYGGWFHCWVDFAGHRLRVPLDQDAWRRTRAGHMLDVRYDPEKPGELAHGKLQWLNVANLLWASMAFLGALTAVVAWRLWFR